MRFIVYGAGAVGGVVGGRLAEHGHDVVLIARGAHAEAMRADGLTIESVAGSTTVAVPVVTGPDDLEIDPDDVVLLAVKSPQTAEALAALRPVASPSTPVVSLQNGVDNERYALRLFERVYGVCVMLPAQHLVPGVVRASSSPVSGILDIGRYPRDVDGTAETVASALSDSTFVSEPRADIMRWKYRKLLANLGNGVDAVCGPDARGGPLTRMAREEGTAALIAAGIPFASEAENAERRGDLLQPPPHIVQPGQGSSSWQSLRRHTGSIETDFLNGEIVLLGRRHGVPTPVNALLQRLAAQLAATRAEPGSIPAEQVLAMLGGPEAAVPTATG